MNEIGLIDFSNLPDSAEDFMAWNWVQVQPYSADLLARSLSAEEIPAWLADWSQLLALASEGLARCNRTAFSSTDDDAAMKRRRAFFTELYQPIQALHQQLIKRWLESGLSAPGYERILAKIQLEKRLFCAHNQALEATESDLINRYYQLRGSWGFFQPVDLFAARADREEQWRKAEDRRLQDRKTINDLWGELLAVRQQMAINAGYPNFLEFQWAHLQRTEFTAADCLGFHHAVEASGVPAATRVFRRRQQYLGISSLRPWDENAALPGASELRPFKNAAELAEKVSQIFHAIDPVFGDFFDQLRAEDMLDLEPRSNKFPGGFTLTYAVTRLSFILMNLNNSQGDVMGLIHEAGHTFAILETKQRSFLQIILAGGQGGGERREFTSQTMELLALPYLSAKRGGFYRDELAALVEVEWLENWVLLFFPQVALTDAFEHWLYTHPQEAVRPECCDAAWLALGQQFIPGVDWSELDTERATGWQAAQNLFAQPLSFIEYAFALLPALQVWQNPDGHALYRAALALGGTGASSREFFAAAGASMSMDEQTLSQAIGLVEGRIRNLLECGAAV